jgi:translation initiation factor IF-3
VPVPRRFDRRPPERDPTRINERIRVPEVRLIGEDGEQIGVLKIDDALRYAQERDLDLVEVAPEAKPPVCRVLDYSKYKYELAQKQKQARKHQQQITIREIKFRPKIAQHDYDTKKGHVERFLKHKDKVKVTIMFRGREVTHPERGVAILDRLAEELAEYAIVEQRPLQDGRNMTMMLGPSKAILAGQFDRNANGELPPPAEGGELEAVADTNGAVPAASVATPGEAPEAAADVTATEDSADETPADVTATEDAAEETPADVTATEDSAEETPADVTATEDAAEETPAVLTATEDVAEETPADVTATQAAADEPPVEVTEAPEPAPKRQPAAAADSAA